MATQDPDAARVRKESGIEQATAGRTIAEAARLLRSGKLTSAELVEACLARIAQVDGQLQACVTIMAEQAREQARAGDEAIARRRVLSSLHGIPLGIKDIIETKGVRTTAGSRVLEDWIPEEDATVVTRLRAAGAIALAKTNTHEFAFGTQTPPTRNPWDLSRSPGGSSGGSAAAVASGEALGALGTDTGGSIRIPAGWCGVTGLKPTFGLVSRAGIVPLSWSYDHAGPIARTVEDCALLLEVLAGYDPRDPDSLDVPLLDYRAALAAQRAPEEAVRGTRIGLPDRYFFELLDPEVERAVREVARTFERLGAVVEDAEVPSEIEELLETVYRPVQRPEAYAYHVDQGWLTERADRYTPTVHANIERGTEYSAADYIRAQQRRRVFTERMRAVFARVDALLTPTLPIPAPPVDAYDAAFVVDGREIPNGSLRLTFPFDLTGQPALALPCGFTESGLPVSAQLAAGHFNEATLLRLGHAYQRATDWHTRQPSLVSYE